MLLIHYRSYSILKSNPRLRHYHPHFTAEKHVAQRGKGANPGSHSCTWHHWDLNPGQPDFQNLGSLHYKTLFYSNMKILNVVYNKAFKKMPTTTEWLCLARNPPTKETSQYSDDGKSILQQNTGRLRRFS